MLKRCCDESCRKIGSYSQEKGSFKSWLSVVTRNTALNHAKKLRREPDMRSLDSDIVSSNGNPEEELIKSETLRKLELIVQNLSPRDKMLFIEDFIIVSLFRRLQLKWV